MNRKSLISGAVFLAVVVVLLLADMRIRANDTRDLERAQINVDMHVRQIEISLGRMEEISRRNALCASATRAFQQEYAQIDKSFSGVQTFRAVFAQSKPRMVGPLVEPLRSAMQIRLFELGNALDSYGGALMSQESTKVRTGDGVIGSLQRAFGPVE